MIKKNGQPIDVHAKKENFQIHHIQPKLLNGTDDPKNLVYLTLEEHHKAHDYIRLFSGKMRYYEMKAGMNITYKPKEIQQRNKVSLQNKIK